MEENPKYVAIEDLQAELLSSRKKSMKGNIPNNERIELAYNILGSALGLAGQANAMIAGSLGGKPSTDTRVWRYLDGARTLIDVVSGIVRVESWGEEEVPF